MSSIPTIHYQPSYEVVDQVEQVEDYLLFGNNNSKKTQQVLPTTKVAATATTTTTTTAVVVPTGSSNIKSNLIPTISKQDTIDQNNTTMMKLPFLSTATTSGSSSFVDEQYISKEEVEEEVDDTVVTKEEGNAMNVNTQNDNDDDEEEEGQEALWLEEEVPAVSSSPSTLNTDSPKSIYNRNVTTNRRRSFFTKKSTSTTKQQEGGGNHGKVTTVTTPRNRTISFRNSMRGSNNNKKEVPKIKLLEKQEQAKPLPSTVAETTTDTIAALPISDTTISSLTTTNNIHKYDTITGSTIIETNNNTTTTTTMNNVQSPLSMSSLNEILDAPITPTTAAVVVASEGTKQKKSTSRLSTMFLKKKEKKVKGNNSIKKSFSFMKRTNSSSQYARSVTVVDKTKGDKDDDDDDDEDLYEQEPILEVTRNIDERIQQSLLRAMENDDAESLTSYTGVPVMISKADIEANNNKKKSSSLLFSTVTVTNKSKSVQQQQQRSIPGQKPLNFDKVKPSFVPPDTNGVSTLMTLQEKYFPSVDDDDDDDDEEQNNNAVDSPTSTDYDEQHGIEALKSISPISNDGSKDTAMTDRYATTTRNGDTDNDDDEDDENGSMNSKNDKYTVLSDPCSLCNSFWITTETHHNVANTTIATHSSKNVEVSSNEYLDTTPTLVELSNNQDINDSPLIDKYASTEDDNDIIDDTAVVEAKSVSTKRRISLFGKFKRNTVVTTSEDSPAPQPLSSDDTNVDTNTAEDTVEHVATPEPVDDENAHVPSNQSTVKELIADEPDANGNESIVAVTESKTTKKSFFGKFKRSSNNCNMASGEEMAVVDPDLSVVQYNNPSELIEPVKTPIVPKKSILKKKNQGVKTIIPFEQRGNSFVVPGVNAESPGARISVLSLGDEPYNTLPTVGTTETNSTMIKSVTNDEQQQPEDPSTEGSSSSADDDAAAAAAADGKIVSIQPIKQGSNNNTTSTDPLLARLRRNLQLPRSPTRQQRRGLDPDIVVDPIIAVGGDSTTNRRLDP